MNEESQSSTTPSQKRPSQKRQSLLLRETTAEDRAILRAELSNAILYFLSCEQTVYLEEFGILIPTRQKIKKTSPVDLSFAIQQVESLGVSFEKCIELTSYHRDRFPELVENRELAFRIYPRMPLTFQLKHSERSLYTFIKSLILSIRDEAIVDGVSMQLEKLGTFYSLHNRQGQSLQDWYAGSDIFLVSRFNEVIKVDQPKVMELPLLESAWELFDAAYGEPVLKREIQLAKELFRLGYSQADLALPVDLQNSTLKVAAYKIDNPGKGSSTLLYCTDGLRLAAQNGIDSTAACEITVQAELKGQYNPDEDLPGWPIDIVILGWLLLQNSKTKSLQPQMVLSADTTIGSGQPNPMRSILTVPLRGLSLPQRTAEGFFYYINVVGVTDDEARLAEMRSPAHLTDLLTARQYDQVTRPERRSLLSLTKHSPQHTEPVQAVPVHDDQGAAMSIAH